MSAADHGPSGPYLLLPGWNGVLDGIGGGDDLDSAIRDLDNLRARMREGNGR